MLHEEVLLDGRGGDLDVEGLVFDEEVGGVALDVFAHDNRPSLDNLELVVRGLNAIDAHELAYNGVNSFGVAAAHRC